MYSFLHIAFAESELNSLVDATSDSLIFSFGIPKVLNEMLRYVCQSHFRLQRMPAQQKQTY